MAVHFNIKFAAFAVEHVNLDHQDALLILCEYHLKTKWAQRATLLSYDHQQMSIEAVNASGELSRLQIPFVKTLQNAEEFRTVLIEMLKSAKEKLAH
jgi:hypothetical protein